jgi:hypothetical protein
MGGVTTFTSEIEVGAHNIILDADGTAFNLGATKEGGVLKAEPGTFERTIHRFGKTPYDIRVTGWQVEIEAILLARGDLDVLTKVLDGSVKSTSGLDNVVDLDPRPRALNKYDFVLRPIANAAESVDDIVIWQGSIIPKLAIPFKIDQDQEMAILIKGLLQETTGTIRLLRFGKPSILASTKSYFPQT